MNKTIAAKRLGVSVRSLQRAVHAGKLTVTYKRGNSGKQEAVFDEGDIDRYKEELRSETVKPAISLQETPASSGDTALAHNVTEEFLSFTEVFVRELQIRAELQIEASQSLQAALDPWPVWLTRAEAIERTGLPASWFDAGVSSKGEDDKPLLPHTGEGRGRRFHRDELRAFAERVRETGFLTKLLK